MSSLEPRISCWQDAETRSARLVLVGPRTRRELNGAPTMSSKHTEEIVEKDKAHSSTRGRSMTRSRPTARCPLRQATIAASGMPTGTSTSTPLAGSPGVRGQGHQARRAGSCNGVLRRFHQGLARLRPTPQERHWLRAGMEAGPSRAPHPPSRRPRAGPGGHPVGRGSDPSLAESE